LLKFLIDLSMKLRENNSNSDQNMIILNQTLTVRILRLIFSLEKNRKYFKHLFPTKILGIFIDIGNFKHNLSLYATFVSELNCPSNEDLNDILNKSSNISTVIEGISQTIGGYTVIELIGKGGFGSVYK